MTTRDKENLERKNLQKIKVRQMEIDDIPSVYHLGERLFTSDDLPILYRTWDPYELTTAFNSDPEYCFVAETDDKVVGFLLATTVEKEGTAWKKYGYISWVGVDEEYQGSHLAHRLYRKVEQELRSIGVRMILADTEQGNRNAIDMLAYSAILGCVADKFSAGRPR